MQKFSQRLHARMLPCILMILQFGTQTAIEDKDGVAYEGIFRHIQDLVGRSFNLL